MPYLFSAMGSTLTMMIDISADVRGKLPAALAEFTTAVQEVPLR